IAECYFFFSSRRRHTRWPRDWSSDVCSSDLVHPAPGRRVVRFVDGLLDGAAARGGMDVVDDFAAALPVQLIGDMLGVPQEERGRSEERRVGKECRPVM